LIHIERAVTFRPLASGETNFAWRASWSMKKKMKNTYKLLSRLRFEMEAGSVPVR